MSDVDWRWASASAIGTSHGRAGTPCQDACRHLRLRTAGGPVLVGVVCDGAGSAAHSDVGSALAADTFVDLVQSHFERGGNLVDVDAQTASGWLAKVAETLEVHADQFDRAVRDYACTLVAAVVGEDAAAFLQVGDGAIVVSQGDTDGWSWVFWPQHGEYSNTTNFVVSPDLAEVTDFALTPGRVREFAVFSDGIENLVLHHATRTVHEPFFERVMTPLRASTAIGHDGSLSEGLGRYLDTAQFNDRTDDDKTLLIATRPALAPP